LKYLTPRIVDYGSIADHTFWNDNDIICDNFSVPGVGPKGKNPNPQLVPDCFNEPSHS
jgi:hypothetical protein